MTRPHAIKLVLASESEDEEELRELARFGTIGEGVRACQEIINTCLSKKYRPRMTGEELYRRYLEEYPDLYVDAALGQPLFLGWEYARLRCLQICGKW